MKASLFAYAGDNRPSPWEGSWDELSAALSDPDDLPPHPDPSGAMTKLSWDAAKERLPCWSPASFRPGTTRANRNVASVSCFVVDLDDIPIEDLQTVLGRFEQFSYLAHTSPGHVRCPDGFARVRLIVPLSVAVSASDWPIVWKALADRFGLTGSDYFDGTCKGSAWFYFLPCQGAAFFRNTGAFLEATARETLTRKDLLAIGNTLKRRKDDDAKKLGRAFVALAQGEMYAEHPHRDETMREITWHLACERPNLDPDSVTRAFAPSMAAPGALPDDPNEERVRRLYADACEKVDAPDVVAADPKRLREAWYPIDRDTPYDDDEIAEVDDHEWTLVHGKSVYFRGPHGYVGPFGFQDGQTAALTYLAPAPVQLYKATQNGFRQKSILEIAEHAGRVVKGVAVDLAAQRPRYDRDSNVFFEAPCPLRPYEPAYHPEVATWLKILCGDQLENMIRWLYWLTRLERPCAALYLCGAPDTGKSLLATELAKLWTTNGVTTLESALHAFNDAIVSCPLVFGDEFVPKDKGDEIKRFVSERDRPLTRKFIPTARMVGSTRLILAANNLRFADLYGDLTEDDIQAFLDRFVGIDLSPAAIDYLRSVDVGAWVESGAIPRFAMWVRDSFDFAPDGRFLVRGARQTKLHTALSTRTGTRALLCEWIAAFVSNPQSGLVASRGKLLIDGGQILITTPGIRDCWTLYAGDNVNRPRIGHLNYAISALTRRERVSINGEKFRAVDLDIFGAWAEENDLFTRDELKKALDGATRKT